MTLATLELYGRIQYKEGENQVIHLKVYSEEYDEIILIAHMEYSIDLLPTEIGKLRMELAFTATPQGTETVVEEQRSVAELRADYYGMDMENQKAKFILRPTDPTDEDSSKGYFTPDVANLPEGMELDFIDQSIEYVPFTSPWNDEEQPEHAYRFGEPYETWYVTITTEIDPDIEDNPPGKS